MGHYFDIRRMMLICYESIKKDQNSFEYNGTEYRITDKMMHIVYSERHITTCVDILIAFLLLYFLGKNNIFRVLIIYIVCTFIFNTSMLYFLSKWFYIEITKQGMIQQSYPLLIIIMSNRHHSFDSEIISVISSSLNIH